MKKRIKITGKIISILLTICMIVTLFSGIDLFPVGAAATPERVVFKGVDFTCFKYTKSWSTIGAGNYKFIMDCKIFKGTPLVQVGNDETGSTISGYQTNRVGTYDPVNYKYTFTFTMTSDWGGNLGVQIGNNSDYGGSGDAYFMCANPVLYKLDSSGNPTGSSLINTLASDYYSSSRAGNKWNKRNESSGTMLRTTENVTHAFDPDSSGDYMAYFPAGEDGYQVLAYKDNSIYLPTGTYRITLDLNRRASGDATVQFRSGTEIATAYTTTKISTNGFTEVWEATVSTAVNGIGLFIGNYGKGTDADLAFKNISCRKYENGELVGANLLSPLNANNYDQHSFSGSRQNAANGKWTPLNCNASRITVGTIDYYYFSDISDYTDGTNMITRFTHGNTYKIQYNNTLRYLAAGTYELGFNWKTLRGTGANLKLVVGGTTIVNRSVGTASSTSGGDVYNATNYTRKVTFTLADPTVGIQIEIGNSNTTTSFVISNAYLYKSGESANKIHNICSANLGSKSATTDKKWCIQGSSDKYIDLRTYDSDMFTASGPAAQRVTFKDIHDWTILRYDDYSPASKIVSGHKYKLEVDCRQYSATLLNIDVLLDNSSVSGTKQYDDTNRKFYLTFTASKTPSDSFFVRIGNFGNGGANASVGHVYLYEVNDAGAHLGDSIIEDINTFTIDKSASSTEHSQIWNTRGYDGSTTIYFSSIPTNYFTANTAADYAVHFSPGANYQVLYYKDQGAFISAGTYRLYVDKNLMAGTDTIRLMTGDAITTVGQSTETAPTLISENGNYKVYEFTLEEKSAGYGLMIGNLNNDASINVTYRAPALYKYENGAKTGYNYLEPINDNTYEWRNWAGNRSNARNSKWTPINCNSTVFQTTDTAGDTNLDWTTDFYDYIHLKRVRCGATGANRDYDVNANGIYDNYDFQYLRNAILGLS